jgi:hypothetical protein
MFRNPTEPPGDTHGSRRQIGAESRLIDLSHPAATTTVAAMAAAVTTAATTGSARVLRALFDHGGHGLTDSARERLSGRPTTTLGRLLVELLPLDVLREAFFLAQLLEAAEHLLD